MGEGKPLLGIAGDGPLSGMGAMVKRFLDPFHVCAPGLLPSTWIHETKKQK